MLTPYDELAATRGGHRRCRFVDEFLINPVASEAVKAAGYSTKNPRQRGWALMRIPLVAAAVAQKIRELIRRTKITPDQVLHELSIIAFSDLDDYEIDPATGHVRVAPGVPEYALRAIKSITFTVITDADGNETRHTEITLWNKMRALRLVLKYLGMLKARRKGEPEVTPPQCWKIGDRLIWF